MVESCRKKYYKNFLGSQLPVDSRFRSRYFYGGVFFFFMKFQKDCPAGGQGG